MPTPAPSLLVAGLLALSGPAQASSPPALVGTSTSFFHSAVCQHLGCTFQGVRRTRLEGSGNPVRLYAYGLRAGGTVEVTRYDPKGQRADGLAYSLRFTQTPPQNGARAADTASRLATAAAGYAVSAPQFATCWKTATCANSGA